ncbi:hypothetical protein [Bradyrhizobium guangzhouense]|uniref:Uncharacterized protein n=1 Tax=Bradyrhizobium guangzhouense TaxID=1325095 RepID=A0AAE5WVX7_9BRAD|nr:hypothetical protein [Bradyrhizobium guangzhouense]QAU44072.1 hypothetical protein XH91_01005 [Bradyrhizobium guangzhouense]
MAEEAKSPKKPTESKRRDGRKAMLTYMKPALIKKVKRAAASKELKAWQFIEKAVEDALASEKT